MSSTIRAELEPLFEPLQLNCIRLANRFVMPGMQRGWCQEGRPDSRLGNYYRERAIGGVSLIITEACAVDHESATQGPYYGRLTRQTIDSWRDCIAAAQQGGAHLLVQLWHEGAIRRSGGDGPQAHFPTLSPSGLIQPGNPNGRAATAAELVDIRNAFVRSALLAQEAGADGVEVHGAHGYLLDQFLWAGTNLRDDGYGGPAIADRVRFPAEIVAAIRAATGPDFVISFRMSQWKELDFTARVAETVDDLRIMIETLTQAGVDLFHVSTRRFFKPEWPDSDLGLAAWVKSMTDAAVCAVGSVGLSTDIMQSLEAGMNTSSELETSLRELARRFRRGDFDLIAVGRSNISDPNWVTKVREGRFDEVRAFRREDVARPGQDNSPNVAPSFLEARKAEAERDAQESGRR
ncbi:MAG: 12-oxophytodienoate reductase [Sphingobium sp.]|nr:12-oxophytodienoate reductase [Sphingobium sp.]